MKTLDFFQLWYEEKQIQSLYDFAKPYQNEFLTPYFENSTIVDLVSQSDADLIGVASWHLRKKRMSLPAYRQLNQGAGTALTHEKIIRSSFDIAVLLPMPAGHRMLATAALSFGELWRNTFRELGTFLRDDLMMIIPDEVTIPIYGNHFITRREIYKDYVSECLIPVLQHMDLRRDIFWQNSGYVKAKANNSGIDSVQRYQERSGREDWPIAPFLLETLISLWMNGKKLSTVTI